MYLLQVLGNGLPALWLQVRNALPGRLETWNTRTQGFDLQVRLWRMRRRSDHQTRQDNRS